MEKRKGKFIPQDMADDLTEVINLEAINHLPKATEHFISDLHGEFEAFDHLMRNCSGIISIKVADVFDGILTKEEQKHLSFIIYYPEEFLENAEKAEDEWLILLNRLVKLTRHVSSKYTRSKVRKAIPEEYAYIIEELLYQYDQESNKQAYYDSIFSTIIRLGIADSFAITIAHLIQDFVVDHLHVLGDIYDRGPSPDLIIDRLIDIPSLDIQLGNHDIIWMGAYSGSLACLAIALRISFRYGNVELIEDGYNIDLSRFKKFSRQFYQENKGFRPKGLEENQFTDEEILDINLMHQAISIIQFKLEGQIIQRRPEFEMDDRLLLDKLSEDRQSINIDGIDYPIVNGCFQTVNLENPYELTLGEELVILDLLNQFQRSERFSKHITFLVEKGSLYSTYNGNLLFHGCIPCTDDGKFMPVQFENEYYSGKSLMEYYQNAIYKAFECESNDDYSLDIIWYLWCGEGSTLFGKKTMKTFERYYIEDKATHKEAQNIYYALRDEEKFVLNVLDSFGLDETGYVINGHTPVKAMEGENPIKANGKLLVIDGGLSKAYQSVTGIAGYTLVDNSHEVYLCAHRPFTSKKHAIENYVDILPKQIIVYQRPYRAQVKDTDIGRNISEQIHEIREKWYI